MPAKTQLVEINAFCDRVVLVLSLVVNECLRSSRPINTVFVVESEECSRGYSDYEGVCRRPAHNFRGFFILQRQLEKQHSFRQGGRLQFSICRRERKLPKFLMDSECCIPNNYS